MTLTETRQLGIEFERRVQTLMPDKEYFNKLDTDTIYSFLNQYQDKFITEIYKSLDRLESGSKISSHVESVLQSLYTGTTISVTDAKVNNLDYNNPSKIDTSRSITWELPDGYYIRSVSNVSSTYNHNGIRQIEGVWYFPITLGSNSNVNVTSTQMLKVLPNKMVSQIEVDKFLESPYDSLRILRQPIAVLNTHISDKPTITCIYDRYTNVDSIRIMYYKKPSHFSILVDNKPCELPMKVFDDLVTGAVNLYIQYVSGGAKKDEKQEKQKQNSED